MSLRAAALKALAGVGDPKLGEWEEWSGKAFHIRRRLTPEEELLTGPVVDIRGTQEAIDRALRVMKQVPWMPKKIIVDEIGVEL